MNDYYFVVTQASIGLLQSLGYRIVHPEPTCHEKEIIIKALGQSFEGNKRSLYKTEEGKWFLTYSKSGLLDVGQVHQSVINELIKDGNIKLTYPDAKGCYTLSANELRAALDNKTKESKYGS